MSRPVSEVLRLENRLMQADQANDLQVIAGLIAEEAVLATPLGTMMRKCDVMEALLLAGESIFSRYERSELKLREYASTVVVNCIIDLENASFSGLYRFTRVWTQIQGGWQVIAGNITARHELAH
jgi:hypothetical protein